MIGARAVRSPSSVGFVLLDNIPTCSDWCEVLASRGGGGGQHEVLVQLKLSGAESMQMTKYPT